MPANPLLEDAFERVRQLVTTTVEGLSEEELGFRPDAEANPVGWLVWHLTRIQDDHMAELADVEQAWTADGWARRFDLPWADTETGYGQGPDDVDRVAVGAELLVGYHDAVARRTAAYLTTLGEGDWDRVVDERWDPPVTVTVRLVSVLSDDLQHVGQAAYARGLALRARRD